MTEQQKYMTIQTLGDLEIRRYAPYVTADVVVEGEYQSAGNKGFRPLANYIFSNKIAMTAPVIVEQKQSDKWQVSFVMPDKSQLEDMPAPQGGVSLRSSNGEVCAAISFRGYTGDAKIRKMTKKLQSLIAVNGLTTTGTIRVARFDPPWKPGIARHNELIVPIAWND